MRSTLRRTVVSALAVLALAFGLAACGGSEKSDDASAEPKESTSAPAESSSAPAEGEGPEPGEELTPKEFTDLFSAEANDYKTVHMTIEGVDEGRPLTMEADIDASNPKRPKMRMVGEVDGEKFEFVLVEGATYMGKPGSGEPYLKFAQDRGASAPFGLGAESGNLAKEFAKEDYTKVTFVGEEEIEGVTVRHYEVEAKRDPKSAQLYLDDQGRLVRMEAEGGGSPMKITFSAYGEPVNIKPPKKFEEFTL